MAYQRNLSNGYLKMPFIPICVKKPLDKLSTFDESENFHSVKFSLYKISIQYILDLKMSEWASKNVVGITCSIDLGGWSKKVFLNEYSNVFYQNPQSELLNIYEKHFQMLEIIFFYFMTP